MSGSEDDIYLAVAERADGAEARVMELEVGDVKRVADICRLTLERDDGAARVEEIQQALERAHYKLLAYVGVCKDDTELNNTILPMIKTALDGDGSAVADVIAAAQLVAEGKAIEVGTTPLRMNNLRKALDRLPGGKDDG